MTSPLDETAFLQKYGATDMSPVREAKPREPAWTPAEREEMRRFEETRANAVYLGWPAPKAEPLPAHIESAVTAALAVAFRRKAAAKREQVREGTSHPDKFPEVDIRSPEAAIALRLAQLFEAIACDLEAV